MPCPACGSHDLWDDMLAWGCNTCHWLTTGGVRNTGSPLDTFSSPKTPQKPKTEHHVSPPVRSMQAVADRLRGTSSRVLTAEEKALIMRLWPPDTRTQGERDYEFDQRLGR